MERWSIRESYSDPFCIYEKAMKAGMSLVTLTDHNSIDGCLLLKERYGDKAVTGVEATAAFPEDGCKVHMLIYGIDERQFAEIDRLRGDIYELRAYIRENSLAHSVAHATYSVEAGRLTAAHLEKLILLFNTFEVINGARTRADNVAWRHILERLTPDCIASLSKKHSLEPFDARPWVKGFTGGSDDHGGIFVGRSFTESPGGSAGDLLEAIRGRNTSPKGMHGDYETLAFSVYKVVHDFSSRENGGSGSLLSQMAETLFAGKPVGVMNRVRIKRLRSRARRPDSIYEPFYALVEGLSRREFATLEEAIRFVYAGIADLSDSFLKRLLGAIEKKMAKADFPTMVAGLQASVPGVFLALPFILSMHHHSRNRQLVGSLASTLEIDPGRTGPRVLWFTDTLNDLNGVSVTLQEVGRIACEQGYDLKIATCLRPGQHDAPPNVMDLPSIHQFALPYYETYRLNVPSVLKSLREIYRFDPDRIYISTPGPIGMLGLIAAKLLNVKSVGFYHTDFALQAREIVEDSSVARILESYTRWFYGAMDEIRVPTMRYIDMLEARGFDVRKMKHFTRGIDIDAFRPHAHPGGAFLRDRFSIEGGVMLLYAGRVSSDKGLDLLTQVFRRLAEKRPDLSLLIAGDGPYLHDLKKKTNGDRVIFMGRIDNASMPQIYAAAHLFVFPSATDTFGKAVLEAQACGLPAIVSDEGGPQEIIVNGKTGHVAKAGDIPDWLEKIESVLRLIDASPGLYQKMRVDARAHIVQNYGWEEAIGSMLDDALPPYLGADKKIA